MLPHNFNPYDALRRECSRHESCIYQSLFYIQFGDRRGDPLLGTNYNGGNGLKFGRHKPVQGEVE